MRTCTCALQYMAACRPLLGDVMYSRIAGFLVDSSGVVREPRMVSHIEQLPQLEGPIGLHAARLQWRGRVFEACAPWELGA